MSIEAICIKAVFLSSVWLFTVLIDWNYIQQQYQVILDELQTLEPVKNWQIQPQEIRATDHKTKYGMADIEGVVYINQAFVGTAANNLLNATIRHEFAHLCVGLQEGHNSIFKAKAHQFKASFGKHLKTESAQVHDSIGYKYLLYATLENGDEILFRRVHRKHTKYTGYKVTQFRYLTIKGVKVLSFKYVS